MSSEATQLGLFSEMKAPASAAKLAAHGTASTPPALAWLAIANQHGGNPELVRHAEQQAAKHQNTATR